MVVCVCALTWHSFAGQMLKQSQNRVNIVIACQIFTVNLDLSISAQIKPQIQPNPRSNHIHSHSFSHHTQAEHLSAKSVTAEDEPFKMSNAPEMHHIKRLFFLSVVSKVFF